MALVRFDIHNGFMIGSNEIFVSRDWYRYIECISKAQVPGVSMRRYTDSDALLHCGSCVGNLEGRREGRARHPYIGKALISFACAKDPAKHTAPPF